MADEKEQIKTLTEENVALKKENETLKESLKAKDTALEGHKSQLQQAASEFQKLFDEHTTLKQAAEKKDTELAQAITVVNDLKTQLAEKAINSVELPTVKLGNDTYELVGGDFYYAGREISIEVLKEEPKLVKELVAEKVANLRKLVK